VINFFNAEIKNSKLEIIKGKFEFTLVKEVMGKLKGFQGNLRIGIRPEDIDVSTKQADGSIQGIVYNMENMGVEKIVTIKVEDNIFKAICSAGFEAEVNAKINVKFNQTMLHFFNQDTGENLL
jgi:multiple sugar transport system ATP-binding protein